MEATRALSKNPAVADAGKKCQASLVEVVEKSRRYDLKSPRAQELNRAVMYYLARKYLCVCGTSVPSEQLFSQAGYIVNELRTHLSPENVNMLVFLAKNMP